MKPLRSICPHCDFILARCLCESLSPVANQTELIILQHPSETKHALSTVKIMTKCFQEIHLFIGEDFNEHAPLQELLKKKHTALLFPTEESRILTKEHRNIERLVLIDASWKKAKKIFFCNPILHQLPVFKLAAEEKSQYRIRSSQLSESLSTLEASLCALAIIEESLPTESVKQSFLKMIDFQIEKMGQNTYQENYLKKKQ
ncbi:MAG: DTW domain-containing protein [Bacteriovorax sp.]|nr:DTW domain-containing protein [Bacteriovorax sp.]